MNKLMKIASVTALIATVMAGCATDKADKEKEKVVVDKVAKWQKERTPVEVLKSKISIKAAGAVVEALDVVPFGIYKAIADKVDGDAAIDRSRRAYQMYIGSIKEAMEQGKSKEDALKQANAELNAAPDSAKLKADIKTYLDQTSKTNFDAIFAWIQKITVELQNATQKFASESPNALNQVIEIAKKEGGMAAIKIPSQGKDDLAVIGKQLKDAGVGLAVYVEMINADKEAAKTQADYPIEF